MGISTKGRYGIQFILDLALQNGKEAVTLKEVAKRQKISEKYLWQVVNPLKSAGLIGAVRGSRGGYVLARSPASITVREIVAPLEGERLLIDAAEPRSVNSSAEVRVVREFWDNLEERLREAMSAITLKDLVEQKKKHEETAALSYDI